MHELALGLAGRLVSDRDSLEREFERRLADSGKLAFRVAMGVLRNREDAEDVAQEAFVRAHARFRALRDRERFRAWLVRIAWRLALDHRRGATRRSRREQAAAEPDPEPDVEEVAMARQREEQVWRAVDTLPEKLRIVLVLAAIEGHEMREVAGLLDLPEGTVKSRLHDARRRLQERLRWVVSDTKRS